MTLKLLVLGAATVTPTVIPAATLPVPSTMTSAQDGDVGVLGAIEVAELLAAERRPTSSSASDLYR